MDHAEAIRLGAVEKYVLGELTAEQRDQFEEHFFTCPECAKDVKSAAVFVDNARPVLREESVPMQTVLKLPVGSRSWFAWLFRPAWGLAAALALVGVISYQNLVTIPRLKHSSAQPEALASFSLVTAASRGASATVIRPPQGRPFGVYVDIPATESFPYYTLDLRSGGKQTEVQVSAEQARDTVQMLIPAGAVTSGKGELVINGRTQSGQVREVARFPIEVQVQ
jgi:hypothetical protein